MSYFKSRVLEVADFNYDVILNLKRQILNLDIQVKDVNFLEIVIEASMTDWNDDQETVIADWCSNSALTHAKLTYVFAPASRFDP